jgi:Family of unknown function (DUF6171)
MFEDKIASDKVKQERLAICQSCDHNKLGVCSKCGCVIHLKTQWKPAKCPIDKWGPTL